MNTLALMTAAILSIAAPNIAQAASTEPAAATRTAAQNAATTAPAGTPHWEWQYHYTGHHPHYKGQWVLTR